MYGVDPASSTAVVPDDDKSKLPSESVYSSNTMASAEMYICEET